MSEASPCNQCAIPVDRRGFLRDTIEVAMGAALGLGMLPRQAAAMPVSSTVGRRIAGGTEIGYPIPRTDGATIDRENQLILVRYRDAIYAFALSCPHQNTALHWVAVEQRFQCPKHKSKYQPDGSFISGRATRNMDRLPIRTDGKAVFVDADRVFESDRDPSGWGAALVKV